MIFLSLVSFLLLSFSFLHEGEAASGGAKLLNKIQISQQKEAAGKIVREYSLDEAKAICNGLKEQHSLIRCADSGEDVGRHGKAFIKKAKAEGRDVVLNPVVFVPGFGGSALEAKLSKQDSPAWYCFENWDWFRIWLALSELLVQNCWVDNLNLKYNPANDTYSNTYGVDIRGIDFGGTSGIDYLDYILGFPLPFTSVYASFISNLEALGYESGTNMRGIPYDFRLPPDEHLHELFPAIKTLIEETYQINNNMKVHAVSHSMGGPIFVYFLNQMTQAWKDQYIASFIPIAGPWAGSSKALRSAVSGDDLGIRLWDISLADKLTFRSVARNSGGLLSLLPDPLFWTDEVFVRTSQKNYTVNDIAELFNDIGAQNTSTIYSHVAQILPNMKAPFVKTYCLYGTNQQTEISYYYPDDNFDEDPIIYYTDSGDGTVPEKSLEECKTWATQQSSVYPVAVQEFDLREHLDILDDDEVIQYVMNIVTASSK